MSKTSFAKTEAKNIQQSLDTAFTEDDFHILMQLMSRFPHYSYRNILILKARCPHAQMLKKYRTWFKLGRAVRENEKAIHICSFFGEDDEEKRGEEKASGQRGKNSKHRSKQRGESEKRDYRYVPLFDISQTGELEDFEGEAVPYAPLDMTPRHRQNVVAFNQDVPGFGELMAVLQSVSPLPISFSAEIAQDGILLGQDIIIQTGITQLRAVRAALTQIVHAMLHTRCSDKALKAAEAESVVYVVSQRLGLETAGLRFQRIGDFGASREKNEKKAFLDTVQKTAMFLTDSIEGEQEARRLGYNTADFYMLLAGKTASRLLRAGHRVWLVDPDTLGGKWAASAKEIEDHNGPFAVERAEWHNATGRAA